MKKEINMSSWSGIKRRLEKEFLAPSLRGRIQYYATSYSKSPDHEGRAAIRLDGKEIISGCYWNLWAKAFEFPRDEKYEERIQREFAFIDDTALKLGVFDQRCFYEAFGEFNTQSIEHSLQSENLIVRIFAVLDRRVGKRRLSEMAKAIEGDPGMFPETFREFFAIRAQAEGIIGKT